MPPAARIFRISFAGQPNMKIAITSDLHLPITPITLIARLAEQVAAYRPDVFIVAGDVGESLPDWQRCLSTLKSIVDAPLLVLAGNHDLWTRNIWPSQKLFEELLPEQTAKVGGVWLEWAAFVRDGVGIVGSIAWYDYSAIDPVFQHEPPDQIGRHKRDFNYDAQGIDWRWTDPDFAGMVGDKLLARLDRLENDDAVKQIVVATHVPLLEAQMCRKPGNSSWGYSNAYFGNLTLGREVLHRGKVTHVISGHTHVGRQETIELDDRRIHTWVIPSEYGRPAWLKLEI
jgi:3',5'-cyclic AMP phosphodiesterase CpdA